MGASGSTYVCAVWGEGILHLWIGGLGAPTRWVGGWRGQVQQPAGGGQPVGLPNRRGLGVSFWGGGGSV